MTTVLYRYGNRPILEDELFMAENSGISWTHHTFNCWKGCRKVSPACKNCYAESFAKRFGEDFGGRRILTGDSYWKQPLKWNREAEKTGVRYRVFCASLADVFEEWNGPIHDSKGAELRISEDGRITDCIDWTRPLTASDVRTRLFELIDATPNLDWMLLTKRPENILKMWPEPTNNALSPFPNKRYNVWLGTTVENQQYADKRIPELLKCRDLAPVLFLSCEPLLGPVDLQRYLFVGDEGGWEYAGSPRGFINWVIAGGESGPNARPSHPDWFRSLRDQCQAANVPFHFKQWGEWHPECSANYALGEGRYRYGCVEGLSMIRSGQICLRNDAKNPAGKAIRENEFALSQFDNFCNKEHYPDPGYQWMHRIGVKASGRLLDRVLHDAFPVNTIHNGV